MLKIASALWFTAKAPGHSQERGRCSPQGWLLTLTHCKPQHAQHLHLLPSLAEHSSVCQHMLATLRTSYVGDGQVQVAVTDSRRPAIMPPMLASRGACARLVADVHVGDGQAQVANDGVDEAAEHAAAAAAVRGRLRLVLALQTGASATALLFCLAPPGPLPLVTALDAA